MDQPPRGIDPLVRFVRSTISIDCQDRRLRPGVEPLMRETSSFFRRFPMCELFATSANGLVGATLTETGSKME